MGILDVLRRKRSQSTSHTSDNSPSPRIKSLDSSRGSTEKEWVTVRPHEKANALPHSPTHVNGAELQVDERDDTCLQVRSPVSRSLEHDEGIKREEEGSATPHNITLGIASNIVGTPNRAQHELTKLTFEHSNDELSISSSTEELLDDNMLRDDEGNPIDPNEAEKNMLRDEEGNIIDPKTLIVKDYTPDLHCESVEYFDDIVENSYPGELVASEFSTNEGGCNTDREANQAEYLLLERISSRISQRQSDVPRISHQHVGLYEEPELVLRRNSPWRRRRRREGRLNSGNIEHFHIMFHNKLPTLHEDTCPNHDDTEDSLQNMSLNGHQSSWSSGLNEDKFIRARWDYSVQLMTCGPLRDESQLVRGLMVEPDCLDLETGEI